MQCVYADECFPIDLETEKSLSVFYPVSARPSAGTTGTGRLITGETWTELAEAEVLE